MGSMNEDGRRQRKAGGQRSSSITWQLSSQLLHVEKVRREIRLGERGLAPNRPPFTLPWSYKDRNTPVNKHCVSRNEAVAPPAPPPAPVPESGAEGRLLGVVRTEVDSPTDPS